MIHFPPPPDPSDFDTDEEYEEALAYRDYLIELCYATRYDTDL